jgi:hypothetical protein
MIIQCNRMLKCKISYPEFPANAITYICRCESYEWFLLHFEQLTTATVIVRAAYWQN